MTFLSEVAVMIVENIEAKILNSKRTTQMAAMSVWPEPKPPGTPKGECVDCDTTSFEKNCWFCGEPMVTPGEARAIRQQRKESVSP